MRTGVTISRRLSRDSTSKRRFRLDGRRKTHPESCTFQSHTQKQNQRIPCLENAKIRALVRENARESIGKFCLTSCAKMKSFIRFDSINSIHFSRCSPSGVFSQFREFSQSIASKILKFRVSPNVEVKNFWRIAQKFRRCLDAACARK